MIKKSDLEDIVLKKLEKVLENQIIYQYAKFDIALDNILLNQTLRFSDPTTFNNPFDCNERLLQIEYNEELVEQILNSTETTYSREAKRILKNKLKNHSYQKEILKPYKSNYKVSCFSETYQEILMWSHYADKHNGICVGFKLPYRYKSDFIISPVTYMDKLIPIDGDNGIQRVLIYWLTTKSIRWEYEKEIRALRKASTKNDHEFTRIEPELIKEVVFGCNISQEKIQDTINKLKKSNLVFNNLTIKKMVIDENSFLLKEMIIKPSA
jgi:hypothetical protein